MKNAPEKDKNADAADLIADGAASAAQQTDSAEQSGSNPEAAIPESTQEHMGDGSGIRGGYGDSDQTNGLEGGPTKSESSRSDKKAE
ncbi:hypothetical protein [Hymenobacter rubripertinctus]|uniref:Uncharacterized protein n=1 Tax=Hymenobacter rubripertinctus TaxID=2029981 RepID=A0A418QT50_9BACT|nr:hypothetical protein [Hymenobacter rubripertinctus]RIY08190.1 hypothetical protein D0T11_14885 [Hymenobacter rubripertinctus]